MIIKIEDKHFWLEKFDSFLIKGKDSQRFLNGVTTINMNQDFDFVQSCWLTPTGTLRCLLEIHRHNENYKLIVLQGNINEIKKYFEQIIFPSDLVTISGASQTYRLQEINNTQSWRCFTPNLLSDKDKDNFFNRENIEIKNKIDLKEWKINQAIPNFNKEIDGKTNPLELGLVDLLDFKKGCYLGQEKIARLKNAAPIKQEIRVWESKELIDESKLFDKKIFLKENNQKIVGYVSSYLEISSNKVCGLALIKKNYLDNDDLFYSNKFGNMRIYKSVSSKFL